MKTLFAALILIIFSSFISNEKGNSEITNTSGTLRDANNEIMRGTPMVLSKHYPGSVEFATTVKNWEIIKSSGFNTVRVCWVDPYFQDRGKAHWTVEEVLPWYDKCVEIATQMNMNIIINYHNVGSQQHYDTTFTFKTEKEFWKSIAPRHKNNKLVYYEIANEPTFRMSDYLIPEFKENYMEIYHQVLKDAPQREVLFFSFNTIREEIIEVVKEYEKELDMDHTTIAYHMYNDNSSINVRILMEDYRVICTEWFYDYVSKERPDYTFVKQVDGFKENSQTLEKIGSSWVDWRDWNDTTLNELLDTLITDAKMKNYWWGD